MDQNSKPLDDTWTYQQVLTPFPPNAVKASGETNNYVALWYRHGKPVMGRAWNESGVVQCEFAMEDRIIGGTDVGGTIQLLTYEGEHDKNKFFYEWIPLSKWKLNTSGELVRCGAASPIYWPAEHQLGNYDMEKKKAHFSLKEKVSEVKDASVLDSMLVLIRNIESHPPHCTCSKCSSVVDSSARKPLMINDWGDFCSGNEFPLDKPVVRALGRSLHSPVGPQDQYVALWYRHGKPLMGKAMRNKKGKLEATFTDGGKVFHGGMVGSVQILVEVPATIAGFDYCWLPYEEASRYQDKDFVPVHISQIAPCVVLGPNGVEALGQVNMKTERSEAEFNGNVVSLEGPQIRQLKVYSSMPLVVGQQCNSDTPTLPKTYFGQTEIKEIVKHLGVKRKDTVLGDEEDVMRRNMQRICGSYAAFPVRRRTVLEMQKHGIEQRDFVETTWDNTAEPKENKKKREKTITANSEKVVDGSPSPSRETATPAEEANVSHKTTMIKPTQGNKSIFHYRNRRCNNPREVNRIQLLHSSNRYCTRYH